MNLQPREPDLSDIYITADLDRRPVQAPDHLREKQALQELAARMGDRPEAMLPRFVDLAMEMTEGVAAGLSLFEEEPAPGVFRWRYLRGRLARFENATTPRNFSPCGVTLDENGPVLCVHPERVYDWIAEAGIVVPEVLLVPLRLESGEPFGTLWIVADRVRHFHRGHARALGELASFVQVAVRMLRTEEHLKHALEEQEMLTQEMSHRVKNVFAITDGILRMSARNAGSKEQLAETLSGRLQALANAHGLVRRDLHDADHEPGASEIGDLIRAVIKPHDETRGGRFSLQGPRIRCGEHAVNSIALVFHELATNAAKYGALRGPDGRVSIRWKRDGDEILLDWVETGGPAIDETMSRSEGFGSVLVRKTITSQLGGALSYDWRREGLSVAMRLRMSRISD
jgi:two-component sensor histidine kinase